MKEVSIVLIIKQLNEYLLSEGMTLDDYSRSLNSDPRTYKNYLVKLKNYITKTDDDEIIELLNRVIEKDRDMAEYKEKLYKEAVLEISDALKLGNDYNNGEPYGMLDFYMSRYRHLNLAVLSKEATKYLNPEDKRKLSIFIGQERRTMGYVITSYTDESLYEEVKALFIDGEVVEISDEIRNKALEIFKEYNIPKNIVAYKQLCIRLYKGIYKENKAGVK